MKTIFRVWVMRCVASTAVLFLLHLNLFAQCTPAQRQADSLLLVELYNATNGPIWSNPWNLAQPMNTWAGVGINPQGCVIDLFLGNRGLSGSLPAGIGNLSSINVNFWISGNPGLTGSIPASVGNLSQVKKFILYGNGLTGPIPASVGSMTGVLEFDVCCNQLTGPIPSTFGNLDNLTSLVLNNNQIDGPLPTNLNEMDALTSLWIGNNHLTGTIPASIGAIPNLTILYLPQNNLSGCIPTQLRTLCPKVTYGHIFNNPQLSTQSWQNFCSSGEGECGCSAATITAHPADQTAPPGGTATFNVTATGDAPFTYQWKKNGVNIPNANNPSYTTPTLTPSDNGNLYSCLVTNCNGAQSVLSSDAVLTVNVPPSWIGLYSNDVVNHPNLGAELLLDSANTTQQTPNPVKICADGSSVTLVKFVNKNTSIPNANIRFGISGGSNPDQYGYFDAAGYSCCGDTITGRLTHPKFVIPTDINFRPDAIKVINNANGAVLYQYPVKIYHAPIVFVHGLWGDGLTFEKMNNSFLFKVPIMKRVDYRFTNTASFSTNKNVVKSGIDDVLMLARNFNYSAGKVIIIGHSMGGILGRLYLQRTHIPYRNDIIKLITLNSPHYGSEAANLLWSNSYLIPIVNGILGTSNNGDYQAIENLRVNSVATTIDLNIPTFFQNKVASTTIKTYATGEESKLAKALTLAIDIGVFNGDISDLIVSNTSQDAQLYLTSALPGQIHVGSSDNDTIINRCLLLLSKNPADNNYFTNNGFPPPQQISPPSTEPPFPSVNTPGNTGDSIKIISPVSGQQFNPGDSVTVDLFTAGNISRIGLLVYGNSIDPITIDTLNVSSLRFQVPQTAVGALYLAALGGDGSGWQAIDSSHIIVNSTSVPDSLIVSPDTIGLPIGLPRSIRVRGYFDGVAINLIGAPNLSVTLDTNVVQYLSSGFLQGISTGSTDAVFQYLGLSDTVHIDVYDDPGVLTASFNYTSNDVCANSSIQFSDASIGIPVSYAWTFPGGDPSVSTEKNPIVTYPAPGNYAVGLKTYFTNGVDSVTLDSLILVKPLPAASITPEGPTNFCPGSSVNLTASAANAYAWNTGATTQSITVSTAGDFSVSITAANGCANSASTTTALGVEDTIQAAVKVFLQGPYVSAVQLMHDSLRVKGLIPLTEPYTGLTGFTHIGGGGEQTTQAVLAVTGPDAVVDWVFLELRSTADPALVLATRSALVQRDGDVVDMDGISPVRFHIPADSSYSLAVRHRNHLGVQIGGALFYPNCEALETNFSSLPPQGFYAFNGLNAAEKTISGAFALWAGNGRVDLQLKYNGSNNDRNAILSIVGLATPNAIVPGYKVEDYNLDGLVKYNGSGNDRNVLLGNVGITTPSAILWDQVAQ